MSNFTGSHFCEIPWKFSKIKTSSEFQNYINLQANILPLKTSDFAYSVIKNNATARKERTNKTNN